MDDARRTSFDRKAELYDAVRPGYPAEAVAYVRARVAGDRALEIGAGTGKATALFERWFDVTAIEPGANMISRLRVNAPRAAIVQTTFEQWPGADGSFDLVYAAQAIHWVDPAVRYVKIAAALRRGGTVAIVRNEKGAFEPSLRADLDVAYARWHPAATDLRSADRACDEYVAELDASRAFGAVDVARFAWHERVTTAAYLALLDTYSDHAVMEEEARHGLYADIAAAIDRRGGVIEIPYVTLVFAARTP